MPYLARGTCSRGPLAKCLCTGGSRATGSPLCLCLGIEHLHDQMQSSSPASLLVPADVEQTTPELPTRMLQLMGLLEREGRTFAQKTLVTLASCNDRGLVYQANCSTTLLEAIRCAPSCLQLAQHAEAGVQLCNGNYNAGKGQSFPVLSGYLQLLCYIGFAGRASQALQQQLHVCAAGAASWGTGAWSTGWPSLMPTGASPASCHSWTS